MSDRTRGILIGTAATLAVAALMGVWARTRHRQELEEVAAASRPCPEEEDSEPVEESSQVNDPTQP